MLCKKPLLIAVASALILGSFVHQTEAFIRVEGTRFVDENCRDFTWVGVNTWQLLEATAGVVGSSINGLNPTEWLFKTAAANNITVVRMFATGISPDFPLQTGPGQYNQKALQALDETIALAGKYGIKLTLILSRSWQSPDSKANYASWAGVPVDNFYSDSKTISEFQDHITFIATRVNSVTKQKYSDDKTILSWNLANEPRYFFNATQCHSNPQSCVNTLKNWINVTSTHLKSVDPNHLVAIGEEGFFAPSSSYQHANPSGDWVNYSGQDFEADNALKSIDYAGIHLWYDNWGVSGNLSSFDNNWIQAHIQASQKLGKPLVLEEFGKNSTNPFDPNTKDESIRRQTFSIAMDALQSSLKSGGILRAAQYWMWDPIIQSTNSPGYKDYGQDQVPIDSYIFTNIIEPAAKSAAAVTDPVQGCSSKTASAGRKLLFV